MKKAQKNAKITLGDTDDSGKGRKFKSRFLTPGVAGYPGQFGNVLIKKESFDKFINTMIGVPVIINHKDITDKNANDERVGVVSNVWFDEKDGWYWCDGVIWDETAQNLITGKGWSVSCSYDVKLADDAGGTENNIPYDIEFLDGVFTHLAIVDNPRYERANIVFNSKTEVINDKWITIHPNGEDSKGRPLLLKDGENVYEAMQRQWGISSPGQQHLFSVSKYKTDDSYKKELDAKIAELNKQVEKSRKEEAKRKEETIETDIQKLDKIAYILKYADKLGWLNAAEKWDKEQKADNGINPNYKEELKQVIDKAKNNPTEHQKLVIGKVSPELEEKAKENGFDISGYQHDLDVSGTRHAIKEHGQPKTEEPRGQIAITDGDFEKIPEVIYGYDDVSFTGKNKIGRETITYKKAFDDGTIMYVEEIRDKRKTLTINTMYKYKNTGNPRTFVDNNNPLSNASIYIITDAREDFNPDIKNNVQNNKEQDMALMDELKKLITKVENDKGEDMDKKQRIMNILNSANVDEDVKKEVENELDKEDEKPAEKADNEKEDEPKDDKPADNSKVKNEETKEDEKKYDDLKKDVKEDSEAGAKGTTASENKCKNSVDNAKGGYFDKMNEIYNAATQPAEENTYISREQKLKYAEEYFAK